MRRFAEFSNDRWISSLSSRDFLLGDSSLYVAKCGLVAVSTPHTECTLQGGDTVNKEKPKVASEKPHKSTARHDASGNEGQVTTPLYGLKFLFPRKLNMGSYQVFPTKKRLDKFLKECIITLTLRRIGGIGRPVVIINNMALYPNWQRTCTQNTLLVRIRVSPVLPDIFRGWGCVQSLPPSRG